jgi:hypothetical protein
VTRIGLDLDEAIAAAELRIKAREQRLAGAAQSLRTAAKHQLTSPSALLLAIGVGFAIGRVTEGTRAPGQSRLRRIWSSVSESVKAALSVMHTPSLIWLARLFGRSSASTAGDDAADRPVSASSLNIPIV